MAESYLIAGLGNPGEAYTHTRHNVGFLVIEKLVQRLNLKFSKSSFIKGIVADFRFDSDQRCELVLPHTFMNHSGIAIKPLVVQHNIPPEKILIVCDDFNLPFGQLRLRAGGSDGGHNGLKSVTDALGTQNFHRLRVGIGAPPVHADTVDFVLAHFTKEEMKALEQVTQEAADCCYSWLTEGLNKAMGQFNKRKGNDEAR